MNHVTTAALALVLVLPLAACDDATEAVRVSAPVQAAPLSGAGNVVTNDLGFEITVTGYRAAVADLLFTVEGEEHLAKAWYERAAEFFVGRAHAHPGHGVGGEVTGELLGDFVLDWSPGATATPLGDATLLTGTYYGFNFSFRKATVADGLAADDPLVGRAAVIDGTAEKDGTTVAFRLMLDPTDSPEVQGGTFEAEIGPAAAPLRFATLLRDPLTGVTLFDGVDFAALDDDGDGQLTVQAPQPSHNKVVRALHSHVHYRVTAQ